MALIQGHQVPVLALRNGMLWTRCHKPLGQSAPVDLQHHRICLVTGGLGTVGFGMAHYMARKFRADLILVRRPDAVPAQREALYLGRLRALREQGVRVEVIHADVCDRESLYSALA